MYEAVYLAEHGDTTPARFAVTAARHGYDGLVYRTPPDGRGVDADRIAAVEPGIEVASGTDMTATDRASASQRLRQLRDEVDVLCVTAETPDMQRFVAEQTVVDVLSWPVGDGEPVGRTVAQTAAEHGVYLELDLGPVLRTAGGRRVRAIRELQEVATIVEHYDVPVVLSAAPRSHLAVRSPRELVAVAATIDLPAALAEAGLANWGAIHERTRRARSDTFIEPGVRRVPDEADDR